MDNGGQKWNLHKKSFKISTIFILFGDLIAPKTKIINIDNIQFGGAKTPNIDKAGEYVSVFKKMIKHTSNRNFRSKMIPLNAERFNLFKYMCLYPKRSFVATPVAVQLDRDWKLKRKSRNYINIASQCFSCRCSSIYTLSFLELDQLWTYDRKVFSLYKFNTSNCLCTLLIAHIYRQ